MHIGNPGYRGIERSRGSHPEPGNPDQCHPVTGSEGNSEVENILTTGDALYHAAAFPEGKIDPRRKEVIRYRAALKRGYERLNTQSISVVLLREICEVLIEGEVAIRSRSGTTIRNLSSGEVIYTPPDEYEGIREKMDELERSIHNGAPLDPLICLALYPLPVRSDPSVRGWERKNWENLKHPVSR